MAALGNPIGTVATTVDDPRMDKFITAVTEQVMKNWEPLSFAKSAEARVQFKIYATGRIADVQITKGTDNPQADSCCLDAVQELDPFIPMEKFGVDDNERTMFVDFKQPKDSRNFHCDQYAKGNFLVFHSIPLEVLTRYPGSFAEPELHAPKNLRLYDSKQYPRYWSMQLEWASFFRHNPAASRAEIIKERDSLVDGKYQCAKVVEGP